MNCLSEYMRNRKPMKHLSRDHHIYVLDPASAPTITIGSGEALIVETWDAFDGEVIPDIPYLLYK